MLLLTTQNFLPDVGGMQAYVTGLADALAQRGHNPIVLCDAAGAEAAHSVDEIRAYPIRRFGGPRLWRRFRKAAEISRRLRNQEGVLVADSWKSLERLAPRSLTNVRVCCLAHGAELLAAPGTAKERRIVSCLAKADVVAANSNFTATLVKPLLRGRTRLQVVWPGVAPPAGASRTLSSRPNSSGIRIVSVARLDPYKGVDTVLHAMNHLRATHPSIGYDVIGDGRDRLRLTALARAFGIEQRVRFHGQVSDTKRAELLARADVFVLPNRRQPGEVEGFGMAFVEAGAFGLPCVAGIDGGTSDAVIADRTGLLVDGENSLAVATAIARLLDDSDGRRSMGHAAHERFWSVFAWDVAIARFEKLLFSEA